MNINKREQNRRKKRDGKEQNRTATNKIEKKTQ